MTIDEMRMAAKTSKVVRLAATGATYVIRDDIAGNNCHDLWLFRQNRDGSLATNSSRRGPELIRCYLGSKNIPATPEVAALFTSIGQSRNGS